MNGWVFGDVVVIALALLAGHVAPVIAADRDKTRKHEKEMAALARPVVPSVVVPSIVVPAVTPAGEGGER